ncbi:MerR family transcriptional regulator [Clostridium sp. Ade.TY]|uniref:MerR family transcriptional regulator n=1 Tax=Clostridium sp. Ade.TY TaxID=1391647 RepID=UPI0003FF6E12|nr:MerR family transcriptional regulator [Clostridium sp. Ade.TY]
MDFKRENYLTISEFGKLCGVERKTLIFYDKEGVFSPIYRDEKGYRYYSIKQYDTLNIILDLRNVGVSLSFIKKYLNNRSPKQCISLLEEENINIKKQIKRLNYISKVIEKKIEITREGIKEIENNDVYIEEVDDEYLAYKELNEAFDEKNSNKIFLDFINYCLENDINYGYSIGAIINIENIKNEKFSSLNKLFVRVSEKKAKSLEDYILKSKGIYASINHKGNYKDTYKSYNILLKYLNKNGYEILGDSYEYGLLDYLSSKDEDGYLTRISIKVKRKV